MGLRFWTLAHNLRRGSAPGKHSPSIFVSGHFQKQYRIALPVLGQAAPRISTGVVAGGSHNLFTSWNRWAFIQTQNRKSFVAAPYNRC